MLRPDIGNVTVQDACKRYVQFYTWSLMLPQCAVSLHESASRSSLQSWSSNSRGKSMSRPNWAEAQRSDRAATETLWHREFTRHWSEVEHDHYDMPIDCDSARSLKWFYAAGWVKLLLLVALSHGNIVVRHDFGLKLVQRAQKGCQWYTADGSKLPQMLPSSLWNLLWTGYWSLSVFLQWWKNRYSARWAQRRMRNAYKRRWQWWSMNIKTLPKFQVQIDHDIREIGLHAIKRLSQ